MEYYREDNRKRKWWAAASSLLYLLVWLILAVLVNFNFPDKLAEEGILINFGDVEEASGLGDPMLGDRVELSSSTATQGDDEITTQDHEDAPVVAPQNERRQSVHQPSSNQSNRPQARPEAPQREVNRQALFPGRNPASGSTSEGTGQGTGNQGSPDGAPGGSHDGTGSGTSGVSFSLAGRQAVGALPKPEYGGNERGRYVVKVQITVNQRGDVTAASYIAAGSTTNLREFRDAALEVARKAKFTPSESDTPQQGVITYIFNIR